MAMHVPQWDGSERTLPIIGGKISRASKFYLHFSVDFCRGGVAQRGCPSTFCAPFLFVLKILEILASEGSRVLFVLELFL